MAKKSSIEKNNRRKRMAKNAAPRRAKLKAIIADKNKLSRIALRELGSKGLVPGLVKSSW